MTSYVVEPIFDHHQRYVALRALNPTTVLAFNSFSILQIATLEFSLFQGYYGRWSYFDEPPIASSCWVMEMTLLDFCTEGYVGSRPVLACGGFNSFQDMWYGRVLVARFWRLSSLGVPRRRLYCWWGASQIWLSDLGQFNCLFKNKQD